MATCLDYTFFATRHPSGQADMYITTARIPTRIAPEDVEGVWNNILECFSWANLAYMEEALKTLSYDCTPDVVFVIEGSASEREKLFLRLVRFSDCPMGATICTSIKFIHVYDTSCLDVHHWIDVAWNEGYVVENLTFARPKLHHLPA